MCFVWTDWVERTFNGEKAQQIQIEIHKLHTLSWNEIYSPGLVCWPFNFSSFANGALVIAHCIRVTSLFFYCRMYGVLRSIHEYSLVLILVKDFLHFAWALFLFCCLQPVWDLTFHAYMQCNFVCYIDMPDPWDFSYICTLGPCRNIISALVHFRGCEVPL